MNTTEPAGFGKVRENADPQVRRPAINGANRCRPCNSIQTGCLARWIWWRYGFFRWSVYIYPLPRVVAEGDMNAHSNQNSETCPSGYHKSAPNFIGHRVMKQTRLCGLSFVMKSH